MTEAIKNTWNAELYDNKHSFVFKYGEDLLSLLNAQKGERILDLGCGTGHLTNLIAQTGAEVIGIDNSEEMIAKAKKEFSSIQFSLQSATDFHFDEPFDAIFSNAVLHWVTEIEKVVDCLYENLKKGGRVVLEFGGKHNIQHIIAALQNALINNGHPEKAEMNFWYFPSLSEFSSLLENKGFRVEYAAHFDRPTALEDTENGIKDWLKMFGQNFFKGIDETISDKIRSEAQEAIRSTNFKDGNWYANYKRLRVIARK